MTEKVVTLPFVNADGASTKTVAGTPEGVLRVLREVLEVAESETISAVSIAYVRETGGQTRFGEAYAFKGGKATDLVVAHDFARVSLMDEFRK